MGNVRLWLPQNLISRSHSDGTCLNRKFFSNPRGTATKKQQSTLAFSKPRAKAPQGAEKLKVKNETDMSGYGEAAPNGRIDSDEDLKMEPRNEKKLSVSPKDEKLEATGKSSILDGKNPW